MISLGVRDTRVETTVDELMNGLIAYGRPVAIVLDDLHAVGSERSLRATAAGRAASGLNARKGDRGVSFPIQGTSDRNHERAGSDHRQSECGRP